MSQVTLTAAMGLLTLPLAQRAQHVDHTVAMVSTAMVAMEVVVHPVMALAHPAMAHPAMALAVDLVMAQAVTQAMVVPARAAALVAHAAMVATQVAVEVARVDLVATTAETVMEAHRATVEAYIRHLDMASKSRAMELAATLSGE